MSTQRFLRTRTAPSRLRLVAIGLGSNVGSRIGHLRQAARALERGVLRGARFSSVYETQPAYDLDQPDFLNACCVGRTRLSPAALLDRLKALERAAGRDLEAARFAPRELDLDILLYADEVVETERLVVPHRGLPERGFVLVPLAEIAGAWTHPKLGVSVADLAAMVDRSGVEATNLHL